MGRRNVYFNPKVKSEQSMYENIIIESLKIYGQEVWYLPRRWQNNDAILGDDPVSSFDKALPLMMYIENADGFEGEGDLFAKFGVEIRDEATFIVARREWLKESQTETDISFYRPREGDLIYLKLADRIFEISKVEDEAPFYQLSNLPVFKMRCNLFENNDENFETQFEKLNDVLETPTTYQIELGVNSGSTFTVGGMVRVIRDSDEEDYLDAEVHSWNAVTGKLRVNHVGNTLGGFDMYAVGNIIEDMDSGGLGTITSISQIQGTELVSQNEDFNRDGNDFIDFSEINPFGEIL